MSNLTLTRRMALVLTLAVFAAGCASGGSEVSGPAASSTTRVAPTTAPQPPAPATYDGGYFLPDKDQLGSVLKYLHGRPFVMLNLFRLRKVPDFSKHPEMKPDTPMTTRELFYAYIAHMDSYLDKVGAKRIWLADGGPTLVGPDDEKWDVVQMVRYPNAEALAKLAGLVEDVVTLREVMLADSRIIPMIEQPLDAPTEQ